MSVSTCQSSELTPLERQYILATQKGLPIVERPYDAIAEKLNISVEQVLTLTKDLQQRGIIRRIAAVPNHYKIGYKFNGMTVWDIDDDKIHEFGQRVGKLPFVSHCYERPRHLPHWNYNLFAMVHGKNQQEIQKYRSQIKELLNDVLVTRNHDSGQGRVTKSNDMLTSTQILKKTGLRLKK
ncbi:MAG: Lrp/AsnC family transcriptional regulator [Colwellia sp.]|nr:Lrp/AsnC family transcriptional regulator [Colwellia sp.]MCW8863274.1 Lrp/AsnC family transcriptional regulator [Colwellia sp.]MCW9080431.1 Lrp/AsnC family transcriptional regulator [Colwellia sp.]